MLAPRMRESGVGALLQPCEMLRVQRIEVGMRDVHARSLAYARLCCAAGACGSSLVSTPRGSFSPSPSRGGSGWGWCCIRATMNLSENHAPRTPSPPNPPLEGEGLRAGYGAVS